MLTDIDSCCLQRLHSHTLFFQCPLCWSLQERNALIQQDGYREMEKGVSETEEQSGVKLMSIWAMVNICMKLKLKKLCMIINVLNGIYFDDPAASNQSPPLMIASLIRRISHPLFMFPILWFYSSVLMADITSFRLWSFWRHSSGGFSSMWLPKSVRSCTTLHDHFLAFRQGPLDR